jgi:hypothetical protein
MTIEKSYTRIFWYFNVWTKLMESQSRKMEISDSLGIGLDALLNTYK